MQLTGTKLALPMKIKLETRRHREASRGSRLRKLALASLGLGPNMSERQTRHFPRPIEDD